MKNPSDTIEQNLEALATEMMDLEFCSSRVVRKEPKRMEEWLGSTQSAMTDFVEKQREWNKLKGDHLNNLKTWEALNCRVIDSLKAAIALKKVVQAIMEFIETLSNEVKTGEPKQEAVTHSKKEKEISLTGEKRDKPKPEGVTVLKEVKETSDLKIDKPIQITPEELWFPTESPEVMENPSRLVMENPSRLVENLANLSKELNVLKEFKDKVPPKKAPKMEEWFKKVESIVQEFDGVQKEVNELKLAGLQKSLKLRKALNTKVIDILKSVYTQTEVGKALSDVFGITYSELMEGTQKRFSHADINSFTSQFSNMVDHDGDVYQGQFHGGQQVIVKVLPEDDATVKDIFLAEMKTMFKTSHRNLVKLYGFCFEKDMKALVFEYIPNGSLDKILFENHHTHLGWEDLYNIAIDSAKGLSYLHDGCDEQTIHRDLKTSNILIGSDFSPKISDFGMAKLMDRTLTHITLSTFGRTSDYSAPEMLTQAGQITCKSDVYSFGMILFEILGKRKNIQDRVNYPKQVYWKSFEEGKVEELLLKCGIAPKNREKARILCMVAFWCIQYTPKSRPSMSTVVKMLEKETQIMPPPNPFVPNPLMKSYKEAVY